MIEFTRHALDRIQERHPEWTDNNCQVMADLAIKCGQLLPGYNGCRRYRFQRHEFVVCERNDKKIVVTVV